MTARLRTCRKKVQECLPGKHAAPARRGRKGAMEESESVSEWVCAQRQFKVRSSTFKVFGFALTPGPLPCDGRGSVGNAMANYETNPTSGVPNIPSAKSV